MAAADYALCDSCTGKVFYDADTDIPAGTVILHPDCMVKELAKVRDDERRKAIADLRDLGAIAAWRQERRRQGQPFEGDGVIEYLESRLSSTTEGPLAPALRGDQ